MNGVIYIDKDGKITRKPPEGVPPFVPKPPVDGSPISLDDGFPVHPIPDFEVKRNAKRK